MNSPAKNYKKWAEQTRRAIPPNGESEYFDIAGIPVCIRLQNQNLRSIFFSAIAHLRILPCRAEYSIDVWDAGTAGDSFPEFEHQIEDIELRGDIPKYCGDGVDFAYFAHANMAHILNENEKHGIVAVRSLAHMPRFELACPFRAIFSWLLRNNKKAIIHSAALADDFGNAYLILGKSGAGKSTTAISCFLSGMKYIGDDLCVLGLVNQQVYVYSLYSSGKTCRSAWQHLPELKGLAIDSPTRYHEKEVYFFGEDPQRTCRNARLKVIFVPSKNTSSHSFKEPSIASLISETLGSTQDILPGAGFESLALICQAFKQAPVQVLPLRDDRTCPIVLSN
jgi:hypothetical protein